MKEFVDYVSFSAYFLLLPFFIGIVKYKLLPNYLKPILYSLTLGVLSEGVGEYMRVTEGTNIVVYNISYLLQFLIMSWFFFEVDIMTIKQKKYFRIVLLLALLVWIGDNIIIHNLTVNNYIFPIFSFFILVISCISLFNTIIIKNNGNTSQVPLFYITIGLLLYYTFGCFIKLLVSPLFDSSRELKITTWVIFSTIGLFKYILFSIGFLWVKKK
jgi:hypothetical protein